MLLLLSISTYNKNVRIILFYPKADQKFLDWVHVNCGNVSIRMIPLPGANGWNVKPHALLEVLKEGYQDVVWIDSDIIVTGDVASVFLGLAGDELVLTEEALCGQNETDGLRARLWGFHVRRTFLFPLNTAVIRVTPYHVSLLERWKHCLETRVYKRAQREVWHRRPVHMLSDQDVLTAILCSEDFYNVPVKILRRGSNIIQYFGFLGFTVRERLFCAARGLPLFIHSQGWWKPWLPSEEMKEKTSDHMQTAYREMSPYIFAARNLSPALTNLWGRPRSQYGRVLQFLAFGYAPLAGLPIAVAADLRRLRNYGQRLLRNPPTKDNALTRE